MTLHTQLYLTAAALTLLLAGCGDEPPRQALPPQGTAEAPPPEAPEAEAAAVEVDALPPECELRAEDIPQMTAERHELARRQCEAAKARQENPQAAP